jgi:hypothetical protein
MTLVDVIVLGYITNAVIYFLLLTHDSYVARKVHPSVLMKIADECEYEMSRWFLIMWLVPYFGVYPIYRYFGTWFTMYPKDVTSRFVAVNTKPLSWLAKLFVVSNKTTKGDK